MESPHISSRMISWPGLNRNQLGNRKGLGPAAWHEGKSATVPESRPACLTVVLVEGCESLQARLSRRGLHPRSVVSNVSWPREFLPCPHNPLPPKRVRS